MRLVGGVVDGDDQREDPREEGEDLVGDDGTISVGLPLAKGTV